MQTQTKSHRKAVIKTELAVWRILGKIRDNFGIAIWSVLTGSLLVGGISLTSVLLHSSPPSSGPAVLPSAHVPSYHAKHSGGSADHAPVPVHKEHHRPRHMRDFVVVRPGDTLWSLAKRYLHSPYQWTDLWQKNPQVTNPSQLHVGERIHL